MTTVVAASLFLFVIWALTTGAEGQKFSSTIALTFFLNASIAIVGITRDSTDYSLARVHWYFVLFFFCIAPAAQWKAGYAPWGYPLTQDSMLRTNLLVMTWSLVFLLSYAGVTRHSRGRTLAFPVLFPDSAFFGAALLSISAISVYYLISSSGWDRFFSPDRDPIESDSWLSWIMGFCLPAIPAIACAISFVFARSRRVWLIAAMLLLGMAVLANPIYSSRYLLAATFLPIAVAAAPWRALRNRLFDMLFIVSLVVVFPMLTVVKTSTVEGLSWSGVFSAYAGSFNNVDFDSYSMLVRIIDYAETGGLHFGGRLVSALAYPLPGLASAAGPHTGWLVSEAQGTVFTNVSAPLPAEAYLDYGVAGLVVCSALLAMALAVADWRYWSLLPGGAASAFCIAYLFLLAYLTFELRGSIQQTGIRLATALLPLLVTWAIVRAVPSSGGGRRANQPRREVTVP